MSEKANQELFFKRADRDWKGIAAETLYFKRGGGKSDGGLSTKRLNNHSHVKGGCRSIRSRRHHSKFIQCILQIYGGKKFEENNQSDFSGSNCFFFDGLREPGYRRSAEDDFGRERHRGGIRNLYGGRCERKGDYL